MLITPNQVPWPGLYINGVQQSPINYRPNEDHYARYDDVALGSDFYRSYLVDYTTLSFHHFRNDHFHVRFYFNGDVSYHYDEYNPDEYPLEHGIGEGFKGLVKTLFAAGVGYTILKGLLDGDN